MRRIFGVPLAVALLAHSGSEPLASQTDHVHTPQAGGAAHCHAVAAKGSPGCTVEEFLLSRLRERGVEAAMAALDSLAATSEDLRQEAHGYAHAIGIAAYTGNEDVGEVFSRCTPAYQSGCYHGVIQAFFTEHLNAHGGHLEPATVNALCRLQREDDSQRWLLFQCAHGMGHGMVMLAANHLPSALIGCDMVEDAWERESCYGGVFMENIVHVTTPANSAGRPHAGDHHAHGGPSEHAPLGAPHTAFPPLKREEPLYPCTALPERYLVACYQMQTSAILYFNGSDVAATARVCATTPEAYRGICFQSLGRDISSITVQDHARAMRLCATAPADYQPWCHVGYTKNLVDVTADPADGFAYCRLLPAGESKRVCYVAVGEQIWVLAEARERREAMCRASEAAYLEACRHGAGLTEEHASVRPTARLTRGG